MSVATNAERAQMARIRVLLRKMGEDISRVNERSTAFNTLGPYMIVNTHSNETVAWGIDDLDGLEAELRRQPQPLNAA